MKKIIFIVLCFILVGSYFIYKKETGINIEKSINSGKLILNIEVPESDGTKVSFLEVGKFNNKEFLRSNFDIKNSSAKGSLVLLIDHIVTLNTDKFLLPFFVNYGGSGTFLYIGLFKLEIKKIKHVDSIFIGDRVDILNLKVKDNLKVVLEYNDYKKNRSMSTIPDKYKNINLVIEGEKIIKISTD